MPLFFLIIKYLRLYSINLNFVIKIQEPTNSVHQDLIEGFPDIYQIFLEYNDLYFYGLLGSVIIKWNSRMTSSAGRCTYKPGGECTITLSEPLLKYRSIKELRETILHELIHAYLFITGTDTDRNSHGPQFIYHMNRINKLSGLNVTVYHEFYNEVNYYKKHIWRCNGTCRYKPPYFGYIKRSINRKPSSKDYWWAEHQKTCGGSFIKQTSEKFVNVTQDYMKDRKVSLDSASSNDILEIIEISE